MIHIGQRIRDLLHEKKIKQASLAKDMGVNPQRIHTILSQQNLTTDVLQDLMKNSGLKASEIFKETELIDENLIAVYKRLADTQSKLINLQEKVEKIMTGKRAN